MMNWLFYRVPAEAGVDYLFRIAFSVLVLPALFGIQLTSLGVLLLYLTVDIFFYLSLRTN